MTALHQTPKKEKTPKRTQLSMLPEYKDTSQSNLISYQNTNLAKTQRDAFETLLEKNKDHIPSVLIYLAN